jgi:uncharacterized protein (TIGR02246 family)
MADTPDALLAQRVQNLEDIAAIQDVQYSYWRAIDKKQPDNLREVFSPDGIHVDFQDMPVWNDREEFVKFFVELGMNPMRQENHLGSAPKITLTGPDSAKANWRLHMFAYDFEQRITIRITGEYDCEYVRSQGRWWIKSMVFIRHSLFTAQIAAGGEMSALGFGAVSAESASYLFGSEEAATEAG